MLKVVEAVAKQTFKLFPLISVTCNIQFEFSVANDYRAGGPFLPAWKQPKRDYSHDEPEPSCNPGLRASAYFPISTEQSS
jgi:hypothetical protein